MIYEKKYCHKTAKKHIKQNLSFKQKSFALSAFWGLNKF